MTSPSILDFAAQLESAPAAPVEVEREHQLVVFRLDQEEYAVPIDLVREVVRVAEITRVPHAPPHIRGVMNLRGRILPIVEIRSRLDLSPAELTASSRVVVVEVSGRVIGLLVDAVGQVARVSERLIANPPEEVRSAAGEAVTGVARVANRLLVLLDLNRVLSAVQPSAPLSVVPS